MLARRVIACLDMRDGVVVKGTRFRDLVAVGDIETLAAAHVAAGADELVLYDIAASIERRHVDCRWVERVAHRVDVPLCVAGGIRSAADARAVLEAGADKISINSPALARPDLIDELAAELGTQCVVIGVDSLRDGAGYGVRQYAGDARTMRAPGRDTLGWIAEAAARGAGEIVLNCMDRDGTRRGFDLAQLRAARAICPVPLVASGGAACAGDFVAVFEATGADGALAAGALHDGSLAISAIKQALLAASIPVRA